MTSIIETKKGLGAHWRILEATSTGAMVLAAIVGGADIQMIMIHMVHWACSAMFHMRPSMESLHMDSSTIRLIVIERVFRFDPVLAGMMCAHSFGQLPSGTATDSVQWAIMYAIIGYISLLIRRGAVATVAVMMLSFMLWWVSGRLMLSGRNAWGAILCIGYHITLGIGLLLELGMHPNQEASLPLRALKYSMWFAYPLHVARSSGLPPYRLQNVISLVASTILTPFGWAEVVRVVGTRTLSAPVEWVMVQREVGLFYIVYIIMDWIMGTTYYPQHFTVLEGYFHHCLTGAIVVEAIVSGGKSLTAAIASMAVESSTVALSLNRVFPSTRTWKMRRIIFPSLFIATRIVLMSAVGIMVWTEGMYAHVALTILFLFLNIYWIKKFFTRQTRAPQSISS